MRDFLMWMALFAIIDWVITRNKRRDQKRWPNIMRGEKYFRNPKRATAQSRQLADKYRKMRKQARTDKRTAEYLDRLDMELSSSFWETASLESQMIRDLERKIDDLEWRNRMNGGY